MVHLFLSGGDSCEDRGEGPRWGEGREDYGGGYWLLQASREQDRWLDTGQSYTAKGCKRAYGKTMCVSLRNTYCTHSHTDAHVYTLTPVQSRAHLPRVMGGKGLKQKEKQTSGKRKRYNLGSFT